MKTLTTADRIIASRRSLIEGLPAPPVHKAAQEGGCGVIGLAASEPLAGRHLIAPARQMHNRGNGKGGGIAAAGLAPVQMRVSPETLQNATLLQVAYLDPQARPGVEQDAILPNLDVLQAYAVPALNDYREVPGLEVRPPDVWRYFVRAKSAALDRFADEHDLDTVDARQVEDEFIYRNSFQLNQSFYASLGEQRAFVLCHGRDLLVFKIVGHAEQAATYYLLEDVEAHVWIAHQRYPTKGRVWHPGGAHPFIGLNEALVHNGDFANYHAVSTYLRQRNIMPLFLTDTEVSVLLFDLLDRVYDYPLEASIEALAPTTERDFELLPAEKQRLYKAVQMTHLHASPDGPWFFIIARSQPDDGRWQLLGITDTSMLRPQVFALHEGKVQIGHIASEKQAIDAALEMRTRLSKVNLKLANQGFPPLRHGIGLHTGNVVAANIGSTQRLSYAMVGETVNIASRIQDLNKDYDTDILISDAVKQGVYRRIAMNAIPPVFVKGVSEPLHLFSIGKQPFVCVD